MALMLAGCICTMTRDLIGGPVFVPRLEGIPGRLRCQLGQSLVQGVLIQQIEIEIAEVHVGCRKGRSRASATRLCCVIRLSTKLTMCEMSVKSVRNKGGEDLEYMLEFSLLPHVSRGRFRLCIEWLEDEQGCEHVRNNWLRIAFFVGRSREYNGHPRSQT